ncbi:Altered inheritance of mitochondria protein 24, mitochondrial [Arachnomyces sp. PD_36]|nr:Altered inheritance of mitochondria protein 24, mitochondrial [Arachnomyces sp. PD_36]
MSQSLRRGARCLSNNREPWKQFVFRFDRVGRRGVQIRAAPSAEPSTVNGDSLPVSNSPDVAVSPDARFDVIGSPHSLLSVSLSASQDLYTQRGTLVGLSGKADNVSATSPVNALISVRSPVTSFSTLQLDGSVDWMVAQRRALLAWTGRSVTVKPSVNSQLSLAHWGNSLVTGRGLVALVGQGQVYTAELKAGEQYIAHPSNVVAYTTTSTPPRPYRFKSSTLRFQVPNLGVGKLLSNTTFIENMSKSDTWKTLMTVVHHLKTWSRRTIWGDRLFLQFDGPTTILLQSRAPRVNDVLSNREVNEIASAPPGVTQAAIDKVVGRDSEEEPVPKRESVDAAKMETKGFQQSIASVRKDGRVEFQPPEKTQ